MRQEWRTYWYYLGVKSKSVLWCLPVSLLFFFGYLPATEKGHVLESLVTCLLFGFSVSLTVWAVYSLAWAVVTQIHIKTGRFYEINTRMHLALGFGGSLLGVYFARQWEAWRLGVPFETSTLWTAVLFALFINMVFTFYYAYKHAKEENLKLKAASAEAKYGVLKNQMQPHFLFNSLNSLTELISTDKTKASEMTQKLADLYREILENTKEKTATLRSEISIVRKYLELEKLRFGERLDFNLNIPETSDAIYLPSLVLQTLVENAIKHGIAKSIEGGSVDIEVAPTDKGYDVRITNTGAPFGGENENGRGISNTKKRLELLYGHGDFEILTFPASTQARFTVSGAHLA